MNTFLDRVGDFAIANLMPIARSIVIQMYKDKGIDISDEDAAGYLEQVPVFFNEIDSVATVVHFGVPSIRHFMGFAMHVIFQYDPAKVSLESREWIRNPKAVTFSFPIGGVSADCSVKISELGHVSISWEAVNKALQQ